MGTSRIEWHSLEGELDEAILTSGGIASEQCPLTLSCSLGVEQAVPALARPMERCTSAAQQVVLVGI